MFWAALAGTNLWAAVPSVSPRQQIDTVVDQLTLNCVQLGEVYRTLHEIAEATMVTAEKEFDRLQKVYLFVNEARLVCRCQGKLLSALDSIKAEFMPDYLRRRLQDLQQAVSEAKQTIRLLELYSGFIDDAKALEAVDNAVGIVNANIYMYEQLMSLLPGLKPEPRDPPAPE